jgi:hypothetical protein
VPLILRELDNALFMPSCPLLEEQNEKNGTLDLKYGVKVNVSRYMIVMTHFDVISSRSYLACSSGVDSIIRSHISGTINNLPLQTIPHRQLSIANRSNTVKNERRPDHRRTVSHLFSMLFVSVVKDES